MKAAGDTRQVLRGDWAKLLPSAGVGAGAADSKNKGLTARSQFRRESSGAPSVTLGSTGHPR